MCNVSIQSPCAMSASSHHAAMSASSHHVQCQHPVTMQPCHVDTLCAIVDHSRGLPDLTDGFCTQLDFCTAGSSSEVHDRLTCHLHCGVPRATTFLLNGTAAFLQAALHGSDLWAGSGLAGPEAILRTSSSAQLISDCETYQPMLVVCLMLLVLLQAGMTAGDQAWELICSQQRVCALL